MNSYQSTAIENHCRLAFETAQPRFCHLLEGACSLVLTVNSGYE